MARISRVGDGWAVEDRVDWYLTIGLWWAAEKDIDYGSLIEAVCKGQILGSSTAMPDVTPHGAWIYADPSVYYDFTNQDVIPYTGEEFLIGGTDIRISGILIEPNGASATLEPITVNNARTIVEDCRIREINPSANNYVVRIQGAGSQANQDVFERCVISRANNSAGAELVKQSEANGYGALRNCVLIAGDNALYVDGSSNKGLEVTDCAGFGAAGYDTTSLILNTSSSSDDSGTPGLTEIDETALADVANDDFRSLTGGPLDVQGTNTPYIGVGLDSAAGDSITLTPFSSVGRYVFNREIDDSDRAINVSVVLSGDPSGGIQWRLVNAADDTVITGYDWSTFLASPAAGSHTVAVDVPTGYGRLWYKLQLRFTADTLITANSVLPFGVGVLTVDNGQSNCAYRVDRSDSPPAVDPDASYCNGSGWQATFSDGNGAIGKVNALAQLFDCPVGYYNNGSISKNLAYFTTGDGWVNLSGVLNNYFDNFFELMTFDQGEADALIPTSTVDYQAGQQTLYDNLLAQMGRTQSDFVFCVNYGGNSNGYNAGIYTDETLEGVRDGKRAFVAANEGAIFGGHRIDLPLLDNIHTQTAYYAVAAEREVQCYGYHLGLETNTADGRTITNAQVLGNILTLNYSPGEPLTKVGVLGSTAVDVSEDGFATLITINDTQVNDNSVVHTLAETPVGQVDVREYYGIDNNISSRPDLVFPSSITSEPVNTGSAVVTGVKPVMQATGERGTVPKDGEATIVGIVPVVQADGERGTVPRYGEAVILGIKPTLTAVGAGALTPTGSVPESNRIQATLA